MRQPLPLVFSLYTQRDGSKASLYFNGRNLTLPIHEFSGECVEDCETCHYYKSSLEKRQLKMNKVSQTLVPNTNCERTKTPLWILAQFLIFNLFQYIYFQKTGNSLDSQAPNNPYQ